MAVNFKIYQSNRKGETNGKYYARATYRETVSIKELAEVMQNNSTVKKSDIVAVLTELSEVIRQELQRGNKVKIKDGDIIEIDIPNRSINVKLSDEELAARPQQPLTRDRHVSKALRAYAQSVSSADKGGVRII